MRKSVSTFVASRFVIWAMLLKCGSRVDATNSSSSFPDCDGLASLIGDGQCTESNNNADCDYDGGDCCPCTCVDGDYTCGSEGYDCQDPDAGCSTPSPTTGSYSDCGGVISWIGDGFCDSSNNDAECDYDGGDCCVCTCVDGSGYSCGHNGYNCQDPAAACSTPSPIPTVYPECDGVTSWIADGICDSNNNNEECGYDGGDCCSCTCDSGSSYSCGSNGYDCQDPDANCPTPSPTSAAYRGCDGILSWINDGYCDSPNNNADCQYDGGDCCQCTCEDSTYSCGANGYNCQDSDAECLTPSPTSGAYPDCDGSVLWIGDGYCDASNNNADCDYDGGDCCLCTCVDGYYDCGVNEYDCQDPSAGCSTSSPSTYVANASGGADDTEGTDGTDDTDDKESTDDTEGTGDTEGTDDTDDTEGTDGTDDTEGTDGTDDTDDTGVTDDTDDTAGTGNEHDEGRRSLSEAATDGTAAATHRAFRPRFRASPSAQGTAAAQTGADPRPPRYNPDAGSVD